MAWNINDIYNFVLDLMKKNQAGSLTATRFSRFWNDCQTSFQDDLLGRFQAQTNGKSGPNTGLIENETIMTKLSPFITNVSLTISSGQAARPDDFIYELALRINDSKVFHVEHDEIWAMLDDVIDPPDVTENCYYAAVYGKNYKFYPNTVTSAELDYIRTPVDVAWGFTFDGNGRQVYNAGTSIQSEWDNNSNREITKRVLASLGVPYSSQDFAQFGQKVITTGS